MLRGQSIQCEHIRWIASTKAVTSRREEPQTHALWNPPARGRQKINTDGSRIPEDNRIATGIGLRDNKGTGFVALPAILKEKKFWRLNCGELSMAVSS